MYNFINSYGYIGLLLLTIAESACIPIPSEITLTVSGALAATGTGHLNIVVIIIVATLGELIGGFLAWGVGRTGGRAAIIKYGKYVMLDVHDLEKAEKFFEKRGPITVMIGRILPVIRTFISLPAGTAEIPALTFGFFTFIGSLIWCTALGLIGFSAGKALQNTIDNVLKNVGYLAAFAAVVVIAIFFFHRFRLKRHRTADLGFQNESDVAESESTKE